MSSIQKESKQGYNYALANVPLSPFRFLAFDTLSSAAREAMFFILAWAAALFLSVKAAFLRALSLIFAIKAWIIMFTPEVQATINHVPLVPVSASLTILLDPSHVLLLLASLHVLFLPSRVPSLVVHVREPQNQLSKVFVSSFPSNPLRQAVTESGDWTLRWRNVTYISIGYIDKWERRLFLLWSKQD